jgi:hypothetical protein
MNSTIGQVSDGSSGHTWHHNTTGAETVFVTVDTSTSANSNFQSNFLTIQAGAHGQQIPEEGIKLLIFIT